MKRIITIIILILLAIPASVHSQYYLGVIQGEAKKIPIVVLNVYDDSGSPSLRDLAMEVLQADLRRSQIFDVMTRRSLICPIRQRRSLRRLSSNGRGPSVSGVVWASLQKKGTELVLSGRLYDAATG
jgi:hypothetical protein